MARLAVRFPPVGASLLAKNVQTMRSFRLNASSLTSIASKLAPTSESARHEELLLANAKHPAARNGIATRDCVRRQRKKGVRLWLFAMAKG